MPIDTRPVNTSTTVSDPDTDPATDACPYCGGASGVQSTPAPAGVQSWSCTECGLDWAITVVNPHLGQRGCPVSRWWATSPRDGAVHLLHDGEHTDGLTARCGHHLPTGTQRLDQPPAGPPCEPCRLILLTDRTTTDPGRTTG